MNIVFATIGYKPAYRLGGPIRSVAALAEALVKKGHRVQVFCTNSNLDETVSVPLGEPQMIDGVEVTYFPFRRLKWIPQGAAGFLYAPTMRDPLRTAIAAADVVHTHIPFSYPCYMAGVIARRLGKPLVYHQRGIFSPERLRFGRWKKWLFLTAIERGNLHGSSGLVALTSEEEAWYRRLGCQQEVRIIPNGVHLPASNEDRESERSAMFLGLPRRARYLLFLSRVHPLKGPQHLAAAFALLAAEDPDLHLVIAGPDEGAMADELLAQAGAAAGRLHLIGMVDGELKAQVLRNAEVFCLPSAGEGFSMAVLEAMSHGTPVVLSPGCYFPEVEMAGAGVIAGTNAAVIAAGIRSVLAQRPRFAAAATALVAQRYTWSGVADAIESFYRDLLTRSAGVASPSSARRVAE